MAERLTDEQLREIAEDPWANWAAHVPVDLAAELLALRKVQTARHIETNSELHAVEPGTVVRATDGTIAARFNKTHGVVFGDDRPFPWIVLRAPAEILFDPTTKAARS